MRRVLAVAVAALVTLGVPAVVGPTPSATAGPVAPGSVATSGATDDGATGPGGATAAARADGSDAGLDTRWRTDTLALAWDGTQVATADESFVGVPVTVPGDSARRTLQVRNDGPTAGTLRAWVQQVDLGAPGDDAFYEDLTLSWTTGSGAGSRSFSGLAAAGRTLVAEVELPRGATTPITLRYDFPLRPDEPSPGNRAEAGVLTASFVLHLEIGGDTEQPPRRPGVLAMTGADLLRALVLASGAVVAGALMLVPARRRRRAGSTAGADD